MLANDWVCLIHFLKRGVKFLAHISAFFNAAFVCEPYGRQKSRQKVFQSRKEGRQLQLMAWRSKFREETLHLVIDLRYLLTAME